MILTLVLTVVKAILQDPAGRKLLVGFFTQVFAEVYLELESDPKYKNNFLTLSAKLKDPALTVKERQDVLATLQNLRNVPAST